MSYQNYSNPFLGLMQGAGSNQLDLSLANGQPAGLAPFGGGSSAVWGDAGKAFDSAGNTSSLSGALNPVDSSGYGAYGAAGIGAAGVTASVLAQAVAQKAAMEREAQSRDLGRGADLKQTKMVLAARAEAAHKERLAEAQRYLMSVMQGNASAAFDARDTKRMANQGISKTLAAALLRR